MSVSVSAKCIRRPLSKYHLTVIIIIIYLFLSVTWQIFCSFRCCSVLFVLNEMNEFKLSFSHQAQKKKNKNYSLDKKKMKKKNEFSWRSLLPLFVLNSLHFRFVWGFSGKTENMQSFCWNSKSKWKKKNGFCWMPRKNNRGIKYC